MTVLHLQVQYVVIKPGIYVEKTNIEIVPIFIFFSNWLFWRVTVTFSSHLNAPPSNYSFDWLSLSVGAIMTKTEILDSVLTDHKSECWIALTIRMNTKHWLLLSQACQSLQAMQTPNSR